MTAYSPVAHVDVLLKLQRQGLLGDYLLLLAHDVLANGEKYIELRKRFSGTIIMDNSLIELGKPVDAQTMLAACEMVDASFAVLPDVLLDKDATITAATTAAREWEQIGLNIPPVIVAQGKTVVEADDCVLVIEREIGEKCLVGIPRALVGEVGSRMPLIERLAEDKDRFIHLLGFSSNFHDDIMCARHPNVVGIDSATPVRLGWEDKNLPYTDEEIDPAKYVTNERESFFEKCTSLNSRMIYNIAYVRGAI